MQIALSFNTSLRLIAVATAIAFADAAFGQAALKMLSGPQLTASASASATSTAATPATSAAVDAATASQADATASKRAENAELLKAAQKQLESGDPSNADAAQAVALYCSVEAVLAQQQTVDGQLKDLAARKVELETAIQLTRGAVANDARPGSFIDLDQLKDSLSAERARVNLVADKLTAANAALDRAQHEQDDSERKLRQAQDTANINPDAAKAAGLTADIEQAKQAAKLAVETTTLRQKQLAYEKLDQQVQKLEVDSLEAKVAAAQQTTTFSDADLNDQLSQIKKQEDSLKITRDKAQVSWISAQSKVVSLRKQYREATGDSGDLLGEMLDAQKFLRDKLETEVNFSTGQLSRLADLRMAWNERYQIATHKISGQDEDSWNKMKGWQASTRATLADLTTETRSQIQGMIELRTKLVNIAKRVEDAKGGPPAISQWIEQQKAALEETLGLHENNMVALESCRRVHEKLLDEIGREVNVISPTRLALGTLFQAKSIWNSEITGWGEGKDAVSIKVSTVITGTCLFIAGMILSRLLSSVVANKLLRQFHLSRDASSAIRSLAFYTLTIGVVLCVLEYMKVPLTAFTIFGGAIAIGVGFGSQAVINNFIGGLIMLAERPARIGERIVFGNHDGVVEEVGFRSTKLRTGQDHLVTIPNSTLVHESIENVGRRRTICRNFRLAIGYDTPRDKLVEVVEAIRAILEEPGIGERIHPVVAMEKNPPRVHFHEYNSDSLSIQIVYWYGPPNYWDYMAHAERVNLRIFEEFERLGVSFASPSKTVYIAHDPGEQGRNNQGPTGADLLIPPARRAG
jgi:potassium-dependent mechanosensitive channel